MCRLAEVAQGMAYLHSKQIIHGDLKAANVLLVNSIHGSFGQIGKLCDFGLAGVLRDGVTHRSTQTFGTVSHAAPEVLGSGHVSPAADVYAFGVMSKWLRTFSLACLLAVLQRHELFLSPCLPPTCSRSVLPCGPHLSADINQACSSRSNCRCGKLRPARVTA